jgi:hypothetical protein
VRKAGRITIGLVAGALAISAIAAWAGVPARFSHQADDASSQGQDVTAFLGGSTPSPPSPTLTPPLRACERPTLIGRVVSASVTARSLPSGTAPAVGTFRSTNAEGAPQVFDLTGTVIDPTGDVWYRALLPMRPNGTSGYIAAGALRVVQTSYRIQVDRERLKLTLWSGCEAVMKVPIGLGKESTPTPNGRYYIIALLKPPIANSVYGSYAYGLSAFSDVLTDWKGGGIIGLHGTNDPSSIGDRRSHGCIRLYNRDIKKLVPLLPLGTPVDIG